MGRERGDEAGCGILPPRLADADDQQILPGVVDGDILAGLEEAQFADTLGGDARGGEVGHAAGFELDADVRDVYLGGQDGQADGADFAYRRIGEGEHDVQVVDHEVEDHVDVQRARGEDGQAMRLKEHGTAQFWLDGEHSGVEALQVTRLQDAPGSFGTRNQVVSFGERCGEGLFDQQIDPGIEQRSGNGVVMNGGNGDRGCVELEIGGEQRFDGGKNGDAVFLRGFSGMGRIRLDGCDESDTVSGGFQLTVDAEVVAAEGSGSGNGDTQDGVAGYAPAPLPSTAFRQRL